MTTCITVLYLQIDAHGAQVRDYPGYSRAQGFHPQHDQRGRTGRRRTARGKEFTELYSAVYTVNYCFIRIFYVNILFCTKMTVIIYYIVLVLTVPTGVTNRCRRRRASSNRV